MGLLNKGYKKQDFTVTLSPEDLAQRPRLHVRCFRMVKKAQNILLFPDSFELQVNSTTVAKLDPMHKNCSQKYRKDDAIKVEFKHLIPRQNKIVVIEDPSPKDRGIMRIESAPHVIGIFIVKEKKLDPLIKEICENSMTTVEESKKVLSSLFFRD
jgi:hypothetical protein